MAKRFFLALAAVMLLLVSAIGIRAALAGTYQPRRPCSSYDVSGDQRVTARDALIVLRASVGLSCKP